MKDNVPRAVRHTPADMLFSAVVNAVHRYMVHKNVGHIKPELDELNKRKFHFSIDFAFLKIPFSTTQRNISPSCDFRKYFFFRRILRPRFFLISDFILKCCRIGYFWVAAIRRTLLFAMETT